MTNLFSGTRNDGFHIEQYGYAFFEVKAYDSDPDGMVLVRWRFEGESMPKYERHQKMMSRSAALTMKKEVLKTGRTVECGPGVGLMDIGLKLNETYVHESWKYISECVKNGTILLNPDYQRGPSWTEEQKSSFISHLLMGGFVQPVLINRSEDRNREEDVSEVVDGQQRIRAITDFVYGQISSSIWNRDGKQIKVQWKDFNEIDRRSSRLQLRVMYGDFSLQKRLELYLALNSTGTPHSPSDIEKVRNQLLKLNELKE